MLFVGTELTACSQLNLGLPLGRFLSFDYNAI